ncbi:MAG: hypothetical protein V3V85_06740 [Candidatus Thorarchaeota archaeon]
MTILAYMTLGLAILLTICFKSRLCLALAIFLSVWEVLDIFTITAQMEYVFPYVVAGIGLDVLLLMGLEHFKVRCYWTPIAIVIGATYSGILVFFNAMNVDIFIGAYPFVMAITGLVAVLEGALDGFNSGRRDVWLNHRFHFTLPWLSNRHETNK